MIDKNDLLQRFLRYVQVDTTADPASSTYPSSPGQLALGKLLLEELQQFGLTDAHQNQHGLVLATLPGNASGAPTVALNSHLDTSPETTGAGVKPQVIEAYDGQTIKLSGNPEICITQDENPELADLVGKTLVTTDGTTLLGGDDKAGIAIIMQVVKTLIDNPELPHGDVRILFTCDEEIGMGIKYVDVAELGATVCYTLDGAGHGDIDVETFSADLAVVTAHGTNIHPAIAKGRMVNSVRAIAMFLAELPRDKLAPEVTEGREGFIHPYDLAGGVASSQVKLILRDFDAAKLAEQADILRDAAQKVEATVPGSRVEVTVSPQYRNLGEGLAAEPRAVRFAEEAHRLLGKPFQLTRVRGGTDGSQLTALGLPTPNLSSGQHNPHSPREFACVDEMVDACEVVTALLKLWAESTD